MKNSWLGERLSEWGHYKTLEYRQLDNIFHLVIVNINKKKMNSVDKPYTLTLDSGAPVGDNTHSFTAGMFLIYLEDKKNYKIKLFSSQD